MTLILAVLIFVAVFYCIITEKIPAAWATMFGGLLMTLCGILTQEEALEAVGQKFEIIFLLVGMMIMVNLISETGVFQWFAIKVAQLVRGEPFLVIILLAFVTAICSAFLDNVTTILLMAPVSVVLANQLKLNPFIFIMTEVMAANIGGAATLIGDPTQLIIGHEGNLSFNQFLTNTGPIALIAFVILALNVYFLYARKFSVSTELKAQIMELDASRAIKDFKLLKISTIVFVIVIITFVLDSFLHKGLAILALSGAILLVIITKRNAAETFHHVEWDTLFFFMGLFIMVRGVQEAHAIDYIGNFLIKSTSGNFNFAAISITWISALLTSLIGNVATATTVSKIIGVMVPSFQSLGNINIFWWALSFGACLGGNISILASATNVVAVNTASKIGTKISFVQFLKFGASIAIQTLIVSNIYLYIRYLIQS